MFSLPHHVERFLLLKERTMQAFGARLPAFVTPNKLSALRLLLVLPLIWVLRSHSVSLGLLFFILAILLDLIDGPLARVRHRTTGLGIALDPIADKILMVVSLFLLQFSFNPPPLPEELFFALVILEGVQFLLPLLHRIITLQFHFRGSFPEANIYGKIKFTLQAIGGTAMFLFPLHSFFGLLASGFFSLSLIFSLFSITRHLIKTFRV